VTDLPDFNSEDVKMVEVIEDTAPTTERSGARRVVLQALYEIDCTDHPVGQVVAERLQDAQPSKKQARYIQRMVEGVVEHRSYLDIVIQRYATEWPLEQVAIVDRNILRMAMWELVAMPATLFNVVIAEATELANLFGAESTPRFVNGVLAAIAADKDEIRRLLSARISSISDEDKE
jgi:N utilization substance protein B